MLQQPDVADTGRAQGDRDREVHQHLSPIVQRREPRPGQRRRQRPGQPRPLREQPQMHPAHMPDLPLPVPRHRQTPTPLATLHVKGAPTRS